MSASSRSAPTPTPNDLICTGRNQVGAKQYGRQPTGSHYRSRRNDHLPLRNPRPSHDRLAATYSMVHVMSEVNFEREERYIVIKHSDLQRMPHNIIRNFAGRCRNLCGQMRNAGAPARQFLVIESDWPEYEPAWQAIERRMTGQPATDFDSQRLRADTAETERDGVKAANAVLREELHTERLRADAAVGDANEAERKLAAAEKRIAELLVMLRQAWVDECVSAADCRKIDAALNPNPEAESHE